MKDYKFFFIFSASLFLITVVCQIFEPSLLRWYTWAILAYFSLLSLLTIYLVSKAIKDDAQGFYNYFMGSTAIRLLLSAIALFAYYYNFKEDRIHFTFTFFLLYLFFVGFEIKTLLSKLHTKSDKSRHHDENHAL